MRDIFSVIKRFTFASVTCVSIGLASNVQAVVIDFDDLVPIYDAEFPCFCDNPLTNQYASKGLLIDNAYLNGESYDGGLTYENILLSGPYTQLSFIGALPNFVSMYVTSAHEDVIYLTAYGPNGFNVSKQTPGYGGPDDDTPAVPNFLVSFSSASGISAINIDSFYFLRTGAVIDNLTYTYSSVPEPAALILVLIGFMGIIKQRKFKL